MEIDAAAGDVPQSEPLNETQVCNNAGGFVFKIDDMSRLRRFVILGADGNNYYVSRERMELQNAACVLRLLADGRGEQVVQEVARISQEGRAPRQAPGLFVLAMCARLGDAATRRAALAAVPSVCRTASTLFEWLQRCKELGGAARVARTGQAAADPAAVLEWAGKSVAEPDSDADSGVLFRGGRGGRAGRAGRDVRAVGGGGGADSKVDWGRAMRRTVSRWYLDRTPAAVAYQATKYSSRHGWSHADLLRLAHPDPEAHAAKRRRAAEAAAAAAASTAAAAAAAAPVAEGEAAAKAAKAEAMEEDSDAEWVVLPASAAAGGEEDEAAEGGEGGAAASEQGALAAAAAAAAAEAAAASAAAAGENVDAAAVAAAAEALRVADMKAIFAFLTHGTLPGQDKPARRRKPAPADKVPEAAEAAAASPEAAPSSAAAGDDAAAAAASSGPSTPLSPVMQYLWDAHRLRKVIRAPPPLVKQAKTERGKRRRGHLGGGEGVSEEERGEPHPQPPGPDPAAAAAHAAAHSAAVSSAVSLIRRHRFGHEHVGDTALLRCPDLWSAFLEVGMPLTALIRNLGRMTQLGVMGRPDCLAAVTARLTDPGALAAARVHPMSLLEALCTYRRGRGARGVAAWECVPEVASALEAGFYLAFKSVRPTGQRYLVGLDVSGSMGCECAGMTSVECRQAAAALLMCLVRSEHWVKTVAFSHQLVPFDVAPDERLESVVDRAASIPMGGTDCALPILHATERRLAVDVFVILTDNETWFGGTHPAAALQRYRSALGLPAAKLVVCGLSSSGFSIADPGDPGMLNVAGLDSAVPRLVADFVTGRL